MKTSPRPTWRLPPLKTNPTLHLLELAVKAAIVVVALVFLFSLCKR